MGSTSSIAKVEANQNSTAAVGDEDNDNDSEMRRSTISKKGSGKGEGVPPPPPPPPPPPAPPISASDKEGVSQTGMDTNQDEVDAPLFDQKAKERVLGKDAAQSETKSESDKKTTIIAMNEADRRAMENMKKEHPEVAGSFDGMLAFISALRDDPGLQTDRNYLQNAIEQDLMNAFMQCEDSGRKHLGDFLAVIGGGQVLYDSYHRIMTDLKLTYMTDEILYSIKNNTMMFLVSLRGVMWNYCDASLALCERLGTTGIFDYLLQDLIHLKDGIEKHQGLGYTFESCVGILHNTSKFPGNRSKLRSIETSLHLLPFLKCKDTKVKMITLLTLSYVLDESQNHLLLADDSVFDFILLMIKRALKSKDHRYDGFSVQELVEGLTGLAKNDDNKKLLVKKGAVPMLMTIMEGKDIEEKHAGVKCMWELSFNKDNRKAFHENEDLTKLLKSLKNSENKKVSKAANGALWEIHLEGVDQALDKQGGLSPIQDGGHIMISYQWGDQKKLIQVKESLRESGYRVWMDVDNMGGSTLQAMAEAVQNAVVVLVCMSERYKESQNCRSEAEYAFSLQKNIVPLVMELNYKPDGWLGMIKGTKLFFEFSGKYPYEQKISELMKELGNKGKGPPGIPVDESKIPVIRAGPVDAGKGPGVATWSSKDVHNWLKKTKVTMNSHLQNLSGEHLVFLRKLSHRAPEFYYSYIERKLQLATIEDMMLFSNGLDSL